MTESTGVELSMGGATEEPKVSEEVLWHSTPIESAEEISFRSFYADTSKLAWTVTIRLCGRRQLVEDILQEAYAAVWRRWGEVSVLAEGQRSQWLFTTIKLTWKAQVRRKKELPVAPEDLQVVADATKDVADVVADRLVARDQVLELAAALEVLTARQRDVVFLTVLGLSAPEIAKILGLGSPKTARSHRSKGMKELNNHPEVLRLIAQFKEGRL